MIEIGELEDVIEVTMEDMEDLNEDQKVCLESFGETRNKVVHKPNLPTLSITTYSVDPSPMRLVHGTSKKRQVASGNPE